MVIRDILCLTIRNISILTSLSGFMSSRTGIMGGPTWVRTRDRPVMSRWLYQLSYGPLPSGSYHPLSIIPQVVCATLPSNSCQYLISSPVKRSSVADYLLHFKRGFKDFLRDGFRNFRTAGVSILRICSLLKFNGSGFFPGP